MVHIWDPAVSDSSCYQHEVSGMPNAWWQIPGMAEWVRLQYKEEADISVCSASRQTPGTAEHPWSIHPSSIQPQTWAAAARTEAHICSSSLFGGYSSSWTFSGPHRSQSAWAWPTQTWTLWRWVWCGCLDVLGGVSLEWTFWCQTE